MLGTANLGRAFEPVDIAEVRRLLEIAHETTDERVKEAALLALKIYSLPVAVISKSPE